MAFDQNSVPLHLRPINVGRVVRDEPPRVVQTSAAATPNQVQPVCTPNPTPLYYPLQPCDALGNMNQIGALNWYNPPVPLGMAVGCNNPPFIRCSSSANLVNQASSSRVVISKDSGDDLSPGKKLKFLCSFGGKILPRPGSGVLRYVGGHTRLIGFKGSVDFNNLARRMTEMCGQAVTIKYQLPGEDLDALVSISCQEDFDIMMEEYDKVIKSLPDGSAKLRLYLFLSSDADNSALAVLSGLNDNGQKYFEAVNGLLDEAGGMVTRKESFDSTASTPSSDLGGIGTVVDCSVQVGQGIVGLQTTAISSPVGNSFGGASQENTPRAALSSKAATASAVRFGIPAVASSVQISNTELESDRSVLPTMPQSKAFEPKQVVQTSPPYMRVCVPQLQDIKGPGDSTQLPSQIVFPRPSIVGNPGSLFQQHQLLENAGTSSPKQFMPAMSTSGIPQVVLRPNTVQQLMNSSQVQRENYPEGVVYPVRVFPLDPSYSAYPTQAPHSMVGGAYGWNISTPDRPIFHDRLAAPQQILYTSNVARFDDCYMCQRSLPHAHSDSIAQQLKDGNESPTSDSNHSYQSLRSDIKMQTQPSSLSLTTGGSGELFDDQSSGTQPRARNQAENQAVKPLSPLGVPQNIDTRFENEKTDPLTENMDHTELPVTQDGLLSAGRTPCSDPVNNMVQQLPDISTQQYSAPTQFQVKQNALVDTPIHSEILPTRSKPLQTPEPSSRESPRETSGKFLGALPQDDISELSIDIRWKSNQSTEALRISGPENVINAESGKFVGPLKSNMLDQKPQQIACSPVLVDCINKANVILEPNLVKPTEMSSGIPYNTSQPTDCYVMPLQPITGYTDERPPLISAHKDDASQFQFTESFMSNGSGSAASCIMPSKITENALQDSNSVFNNQDPLVVKQDASLPPPNTSSITVKNEAASKDPFGSAFVKNNDEVNIELWLEDAIRLPPTSMIPDSNFELAPPSEIVKHELQAVTEGVAAFSLHAAAPRPLTADLSSDAAKGLAFKVKQVRGERNNDSESQLSPKLEDWKAKLPEKSNLGFPTSDLGRLQIINNKDLEELSELGSGTFGTVYHGKWRGTDVAIKRINDRCFQGKPSEQERMRDDFWNEAIKLADLHHPNVVAFYGVVLDGPGTSVATVTEYMVNGSLRNALQRNERNLDKRKRILIAMDVAFGMEYLHGKNIVHFDLKSDNLLVNLRDPHRPICKVGDLGLSKVKCHTLISGGVRGTLPWMAPELLNGSSSLVSEKVDVFSFGIVLWELITGEEPYADLHYGAIIGGIVSNTLRPSVPESCDPEWRLLIERCWSADPSERPSFTAIANQLRAMASKIPPKGQK